MEKNESVEIYNQNINLNNYIKYFEEQIQNSETEIIKSKKPNENNLLNEVLIYLNLENSLLEYIKKDDKLNEYNRKKITKLMLNLLSQNFEDNNISRSILILKIENIFYINLMPFYDCTETIIQLASNEEYNEETKKQYIFYEHFCKLEIERINKILLDEINKEFLVNSIKFNVIPLFLLVDVHKLLKQKIFQIWSLNYNIQIKSIKLENTNDLDFIFLYERFQDFYDDRITLFDLKYLNNDSEIPLLLFKALYYSNLDYLKYEGNLKIFVNNTKRYLNLMGIDNNINNHGNLINECIDNSKIEFINEIFNQLINKIKYNSQGNIFLFIIFCMSMTLNNIAVYSSNDKKVVFTPLLKCSAKEKVFLNNFLKTLDNYINNSGIFYRNSGLYYNAQVENYVFAFLTKSYTKVLYDEQNRRKINISTSKTLLLMEKLNKGIKDDDIETDSEDDINNNFDFNTLDDIERENLYSLYKIFKSNYIKTPNKKKKHNKNPAQKIIKGLKVGFKNIKKIINEKVNDNNIKDVKIDISFYKKSALLNPIDPINTATHICICISSNTNQENIEKNMFSNIINYKNHQSIDYYIYEWKKENDFSAKIYGRLLAFIIAGREIFKFQTITLLGVGYGCKLIKKCLKQLSQINESLDVSDIIQHIIFINGKSQINFNKEKYFDMLKLVSGNLINFCQNKNEYINIPHNFSDRTKVFLPKILNYDLLTDFHIINTDLYMLKINKIFKKLKTII